MIAFLRGKPQVQQDRIILEVNSVGYGVAASQKVLQQAVKQAADEAELELYIHPHIREDRFELYGFLTQQEQQLFELVLGVSGVGPTTALYLVDKNPEQLITAVQEAQVSFFTAVPRVGKKLAQKIIIELRGKLGELKELNLAPLNAKQQTVADALKSLGWQESDVRAAIETLDLDRLSEPAAIKQALKQLGSK